MSYLFGHAGELQPGSANVDPMKISTTSSQTDETNVSQSTVITVRLYGNGTNEKGGKGQQNKNDPQAAGGRNPGAQDSKRETLVTDVIVVRHPRSLLILAVLELIIGVQMLVIGTICIIYNGPLYASGVWAGWLFVCQGTLGVLVVKKYPRRPFVIAYFILSVLCFLLAMTFFGITLYELKLQEQRLENQTLNKIVETTKAAIFIIQMVLTAAHATASIVTIILCSINVRQPAKELRRAFYIADDQLGHQLVLVPVNLRTGADIDTWLDEAAAAASTAAFGGNVASYPSPFNTISTAQHPIHPLHHSLNGSMLSASTLNKSSKAVQTNVTFAV